MGQTFGILGFFFGLLAIFFASEVMRRASAHQAELTLALHKARQQVLKLENRVTRVERLTEGVKLQKKRQGETITALAKKSEKDAQGRDHEHFTPSEYKNRKTG